MRVLSTWVLLANLSVPLGAQEGSAPKEGATRTVAAKEGETVTVQLRVAEAGKNFLTALCFPEGVAHVVSAWDAKDLSIEEVGTKLFLKLLSKTEGHLDVITVSGAHTRLLIVPAEAPGGYDSTVIVRPAASPPSSEKTPPAVTASGALELIRAMRLGLVPPDATVRSGQNERLAGGALIEATLLYVYETGRYRGYVVRLANTSLRESTLVDVTRFTGERLVLLGTRDVVVPPEKSTRLYVVDWK
jgi:hypothetical protein